MPNLYVFDKDGTLVHSRKDGYVDSPEDQILYAGVRDKLDRLRADGHVLAIASNQGGCDYHEVGAERLAVGRSFAIQDDEGVFDGDFFTVLSIDTDDHGLIDIETSSQDFTFSKGDRVLMQYKTIEGAIAEMEFAADLCGIREAYFAPTMDGKTIVSLNRSDSKWHHQIENPLPESKYSFGGFRKPQPGMLLMPSYGYKYDRRIMIGDRDSDRQAAIAAGFEFIWAEVFRNAQE
jgi:histidinol phosphatase-like enzyme